MRRYAALFILLVSGGLLWGIFDQQASSIEVMKNGKQTSIEKSDPIFKKLENIIIETTTAELDICKCETESGDEMMNDQYHGYVIVFHFENDKQIIVSLNGDQTISIRHKNGDFNVFYMPEEQYTNVMKVIEMEF